MPKQSTAVGRPSIVAPKGFVSVADAAARRGVSYSVAYRHVKSGAVRSQQEPSGVLLVDERDLALISKHEPPKDRERIAVQLSPTPKRHRAWATLARASQMTVTELAYRLLDKASKFSE